ELNIPVIDADVIAREVVEPGEVAYQEVVATFGEEILLADGTLNRPKLGEIIFNDAEKRNQPNNIVHPAIRKRMTEKRENYIADGEKCIVLDIPLLLERDVDYGIDKII